MEFTANSDVGKKRTNNEDDYFAKKINEDLELYIVADGMGGYASGEVASSIATSSVSSFLEEKSKSILKSNEKKIKEILKEAVNFANSEIYNLEKTDVKYKGMGTTIVLLVRVKEKLFYLSVGDSRMYFIDENLESIRQITDDDTYVNALLKTNVIDEKEAKNHPQKHMLTKAIGVFKNIDFDVNILDEKKGYLLLCTDGMTNMLTEDEILTIFKSTKFEDLSKKFVIEANKNGGNDNITAVVVRL